MAENTGDISQRKSSSEKTISRRSFLKGSLATAGGLALGSAGINAIEKKSIEDGILTDSGIFIPLYETHYDGLNSEKVSDDLDILFREVEGKGLLTIPIKNLILAESNVYGNQNEKVKVFREEIIRKISSRGMELMVGDVTDYDLSGSFNPNILVGGAEFVAGFGASLLLVRDLLKRNKKDGSTSRGVSRRTLLKGGAVLGAGWLMSPAISRY